MPRAIPIDLNPATPGIEIDAEVIAEGLGLAVADFRKLMEHRRITVLCERGTGEDAGLYRASFYHRERRLRLVVDREGNIVGRSQ